MVDALDEVRELLAEMLAVVLKSNNREECGLVSVHEGETDE